MKRIYLALVSLFALCLVGCMFGGGGDASPTPTIRAYTEILGSASNTPTPTTNPSISATPVLTATPTISPVDEIPETPTPTEEIMPTDEVTPPEDPTPSAEPNLSPTNAPSESPTKFPSASVTPTSKATPSPTPTKKATPTPTKRVTATPTPGKTPTKTPATNTPTPTKSPSKTPTKTPSNMREYYPTDELGILINEYRDTVGAGKVKTTDLLTSIAKLRLAELHETGLSHTRPDGSVGLSILEKHGIVRRYGGELMHSAYNLQATDALYGWSHSEAHDTILSASKYTLMGCAYDEEYAIVLFVTLME